MLVVMNKSTLEELLSQSLKRNNKQIKITFTLLTGYNGIFNITNRNNKVSFRTAIVDNGISNITIFRDAHELESLDRK